MSKLTKNQKLVADKIEVGKAYTLSEAASLVNVVRITSDGLIVSSFLQSSLDRIFVSSVVLPEPAPALIYVTFFIIVCLLELNEWS